MKRMLVVRCSSDFLDEQIVFLHNYLNLLGFELKFSDGYDKNSFTNSFLECDFMFDYIYLTGHSNEDVFGDTNSNFSWEFVAKTIQNSQCVTDNCKVIIKSCKSIDDNIANIMFTKTTKIKQILGSLTDSENFNGYIGSMLFFYLTEWDKLKPEEAVKISNLSVSTNFKSYLRK